jgi:hypothetical protein
VNKNRCASLDKNIQRPLFYLQTEAHLSSTMVVMVFSFFSVVLLSEATRPFG